MTLIMLINHLNRSVRVCINNIRIISPCVKPEDNSQSGHKCATVQRSANELGSETDSTTTINLSMALPREGSD